MITPSASAGPESPRPSSGKSDSSKSPATSSDEGDSEYISYSDGSSEGTLYLGKKLFLIWLYSISILVTLKIWKMKKFCMCFTSQKELQCTIIGPYYPLKSLALWNFHLLKFSNGLPCCGFGYFLELQSKSTPLVNLQMWIACLETWCMYGAIDIFVTEILWEYSDEGPVSLLVYSIHLQYLWVLTIK